MSDSPVQIENDRFLRRSAVVAQTGLSQSSIYRLIERGDFPASRRYIGIEGSYWLQSEITNWKRSQMQVAA